MLHHLKTIPFDKINKLQFKSISFLRKTKELFKFKCGKMPSETFLVINTSNSFMSSLPFGISKTLSHFSHKKKSFSRKLKFHESQVSHSTQLNEKLFFSFYWSRLQCKFPEVSSTDTFCLREHSYRRVKCLFLWENLIASANFRRLFDAVTIFDVTNVLKNATKK